MNNHKILIIEDEPSITEVLSAYCINAGFDVKIFDSGAGPIDYIKNNFVDLILLDVMLPDIDGITLCKKIRLFSNIPIIMITAKTEENDRLIGLEIGADDYICKPFSPKEVIARIQVVLRRASNISDEIIRKSSFELDNKKYTVTLKNKNLQLTVVEFKILQCFFKKPNKVFSRQEILDSIYMGFEDISDRSIDTHIKNIRKKIHNVDKTLNPITSIYGVGYKIES